MKNLQKGFSTTLLLIIIAILGLGGVVYYKGNKNDKYKINTSNGANSTRINSSADLPDGASVEDIGNGFKQYKNPKFHFSFNFPSNINVHLLVRSTTAYNLYLNRVDSSQNQLSVSLFDQNDAYSSERGKPLPRPSTGTESLTVGNNEFILYDNVVYAQQYGSNQFSADAVSSEVLNVVPGNLYSLRFGYNFTLPSDAQRYKDLIKQVVSSIRFF